MRLTANLYRTSDSTPRTCTRHYPIYSLPVNNRESIRWFLWGVGSVFSMNTNGTAMPALKRNYRRYYLHDWQMVRQDLHKAVTTAETRLSADERKRLNEARRASTQAGNGLATCH